MFFQPVESESHAFIYLRGTAGPRVLCQLRVHSQQYYLLLTDTFYYALAGSRVMLIILRFSIAVVLKRKTFLISKMYFLFCFRPSVSRRTDGISRRELSRRLKTVRRTRAHFSRVQFLFIFPSFLSPKTFDILRYGVDPKLAFLFYPFLYRLDKHRLPAIPCTVTIPIKTFSYYPYDDKRLTAEPEIYVHKRQRHKHSFYLKSYFVFRVRYSLTACTYRWPIYWRGGGKHKKL